MGAGGVLLREVEELSADPSGEWEMQGTVGREERKSD
jgi:hypothetical protein